MDDRDCCAVSSWYVVYLLYEDQLTLSCYTHVYYLDNGNLGMCNVGILSWEPKLYRTFAVSPLVDITPLLPSSIDPEV
jgi:hypothetical protein